MHNYDNHQCLPLLGTQLKMNHNNNVQWIKVTMKCSKILSKSVKRCSEEMKKWLSCWKGKMTFLTFASVVICAKNETLGASDNRNVYLSILDAEGASHNYAPTQRDFSSLDLMFFLTIKDHCGHIHEQQLASRLELSSGEPKTRLSYIRLIFSFT